MDREILEGIENTIVFDSFIKADSVLKKHEKISVSISGGADSDLVLDLIEKVRGNQDIRYVFFDTGAELRATKEHLNYLEEKYGIHIERERAVKPIPLCLKQYGQPFLDKYVSDMIDRLQRNGFQWEDEPLEVLLERYPRAKEGVRWWCDNKWKPDDPRKVQKSMFNISRHPFLKDFLMLNPPPFKISADCCTWAKKKTSKRFNKESGCTLTILGIRKAEGGIRSATKSCYDNHENGMSKYRPLFWYCNEDKEYYEEHFGITHSDCYTKYGMKRTGCVGCPYSRELESDLKAIELYEPNLYKACTTMFKESYEYTRKWKEYQRLRRDAKKEYEGQMTFYDFGGEIHEK